MMRSKPHPVRNKSMVTLISMFIGAMSSLFVAAQTKTPSAAPVLRINTEMHTAPISRIAVDRANRFLVTASADRTARVWELWSGRLLRVLRVPIGAGDEGKLYAIAISPDGNTIATSGATGDEWDKETSIYLFDRESGHMIQRLPGVPKNIHSLVFSPDGSLLAATIHGGYGVRVWRTSDWSEAGRDTVYGDDSYGADFDSSGRLVTTSLDGNIRLYDRTMRLLRRAPVSGGKHPFNVRFSPDGSKIVFGYADSKKVDVISGDDLAGLFAPDISGVSRGDLASVAWSSDGRHLYAAGRYDDGKGTFLIRRWDQGGQGRFVDFPAASHTIFDLAQLAGGGIVFGSGDPAWGVLDGAGGVAMLQGSPIADYRANREGFLIDEHAVTVRFGYELKGKSPAEFSLHDRTLTLDPAAAAGMFPPRTEAPSMSITGWSGGFAPKIDLKPLQLAKNEFSRDLAISEDGERFLLGTEFYIRLFNRSGQELWKRAAPGVTWAVQISHDNRIALAAFGDGTIRWYNLENGKLLLTFFPHADRQRWVLWTPSGYYDAAPGSEDLIGWHVNNGKDSAADFFPAGEFRATYYRPDVVAKVLEAGDERMALRLANEAAGKTQQEADLARILPPVVEIISPADNASVSSKETTVRFRARSPSGEPVTNLRALIDGRPADHVRFAETAANGIQEFTVTFPERDCEVSLIAWNRYAASVPATVRLKWKAPDGITITKNSTTPLPKLYVLSIGISHYRNPKYDLRYAERDAQEFVNTLLAQKKVRYSEVSVYHGKALTDGAATRKEILSGLSWLRQSATTNDVVMVFLAGQGVNAQGNSYLFCPSEVEPERLLQTGVSVSDMKSTVSAILGKTVFFVDTSHSKDLLGLAGGHGNLDVNMFINELASPQNGVVVFSASTGGELSSEQTDWANGAFTRALVEGINGASRIGGDPRITNSILSVYVSDRVRTLTRGRQHSTMVLPHTVADFQIAAGR